MSSTFQSRALAVLLAAAVLAPAPVRAQQPVPDLVVVVVDDLGWEDLAQLPTPTFDSLASVGRVFSRFYVEPESSPTRFALQFGTYAARDHLGASIPVADPTSVGARTERISIARALRMRDYRSACFGLWHLTGDATADTIEAARLYGYEHWRAGSPNGIDVAVHETQYDWTRIDDGVLTSSTVYTTTAVTDAFLEWWAQPSTRPRLAFVALTAPAAPFDAPPSALLPAGWTTGPSARDRYEAALLAVDHELGRLVAGLDLGTTTLFVLGDGGTPAAVPPPSGWFQGYGGTPHEGGVRVPFLAAGARTTPGWSHRLCHAVDLPATLVQLARAKPPTTAFADGVGFAPDLRGIPTARGPVVSIAFQPNGQPLPPSERYCVIDECGKKLLFDGASERVYDLVLDPLELSPLPPGPATDAVADALRAVKQSVAP